MRKRAFRPQTGPDRDDISEDRQFVTSLDRGLEVLRAFRPDDAAGLSNRDLSERTGLPSSTLSRLTYTLMQSGYLRYDRATGRYQMGIPVLSLGYACLSGVSVRAAAQSSMQALAQECGEGVQVALGGRIDFTMIYLATARAKGVISLQLDVGSRVSLGRSAMGRAYIAAADPAEQTAIMDNMRAHFDAPDFSRREAALRQAMEDIATQGFCCACGDWQPGVNEIAVPFRSGRPNAPVLAFSLGGPAMLVSPEQLKEDYGPRLVALVDMLRLGAL